MQQPSNIPCSEGKTPLKSDALHNSGLQHLGKYLKDNLNKLRGLDQYRALATPPPNVVDLSHNDYLGLASDRSFQNACRHRTETLSVGSSSSRLISGESIQVQQLEATFSNFKGAECSLYFNSGYAANEAIVPALSSPVCNVFSDELNHASIIDGIRLCRIEKGQRHIYPHADYDVLETMLRDSKADYNLILTESLYSMDGDIVDLARLVDLAERYRGVLVIDEAHSLGLYGKSGSGLISEYKIPHELVISVNPCGKAMATGGAVICGPIWVREYLINTARPLIFTTAASPWLVASLSVAVDFISTMDRERSWLRQVSERVHKELIEWGFKTSSNASHIIPVIVGSNRKAVLLSQKLLDMGIYAKAIRPPTVPENKSRVRLSLSANLTASNVDQICSSFRSLKGEFA
ncbi:MAG: aminotransferase class I/II-fold pyridoxal phosphate-dependent enzyme [Oligoflexales bacterium]